MIFLAEKSLSTEILPHVRKLVKGKKKGDAEMVTRAEKQINKIAGKKVIPSGLTDEEMKSPRKLAKVISCISQVKEEGDDVNPFAVCRESVMGDSKYSAHHPDIRLVKGGQTMDEVVKSAKKGASEVVKTVEKTVDTGKKTVKTIVNKPAALFAVILMVGPLAYLFAKNQGL